MSSVVLFFNFIPLLALILLAVNLLFAPHNPYQEKNSPFECGFHSFLGQNRTQFSISFFIFALLFLLFDLEILLVYPYVVSSYGNDIYGLIVMLIFFLVLTLGFTFELGKNALKLDSRQLYNVVRKELNFVNPVTQVNSDFFSALLCIMFVFHVKTIQDKSLVEIKYMYIALLGYIIPIYQALYFFLHVFICLCLTLDMLQVTEIFGPLLSSPVYAASQDGQESMRMNTSEDTIMPDAPSTTSNEQTSPGRQSPSQISNEQISSQQQVDACLERYPEYNNVDSLEKLRSINEQTAAEKADLEIKMRFKDPQAPYRCLKALEVFFKRPNAHRTPDQLDHEHDTVTAAAFEYEQAIEQNRLQAEKFKDYKNRLKVLSILIWHLESQNKRK